jgi:DNA modification methylase
MSELVHQRHVEAVHPDAERHEETPCLVEREMAPQAVIRSLAALDWAFRASRSDDLTHPLHPYPARFVPSLPRQAIAALSRPGELILDPFSGGGTTAVEALAAGRSAYSIDANRIGNLIGRAKTTALRGADGSALQHLEASLLALQPAELRQREPAWVPDIPNRPKWYDADVFRALGIVRMLVTDMDAPAASDLAMVAFVQAAARLSFQESETRYTSRPRPVDVLEVPRAVVAELRRMRRIVERASRPDDLAQATFIDGDAREPTSYAALRHGSAGLVVTSPPYPNAYDYHLYHRFRLFWLGAEPAELRRVEIGSHLKNQSLSDAPRAYLSDMRAALANCFDVLVPGRWLVMVAGDGLFKGQAFETAAELATVAEEVGFESFGSIERPLPKDRRSVTKPGRRLTCEQVMLLRRPAERRAAVVVETNYRLFPYERDLQIRELRALGGSPDTSQAGEIAVVPSGQLRRAAFIHGLRHPTGHEEPTPQRLMEGAVNPGRRKNSTYFAHGIHRYKGKFYPQLAKALLNLSGLEPGAALVVDPFGGSGTVALEAALSGFNGVSIDSNPLATAIAHVKTTLVRADPATVAASFERVESSVRAAPSRSRAGLAQFASPTLPELDRWFPPAVLAKLGALLSIVRAEPNRDLVTLFEVLSSDTVREISQQEPKDLRIRRRATPIDDAPVYELFLNRLETTRTRLTEFWSHAGAALRPLGVGTAILGDSADAATFVGLNGRQIDAVISSPPYAAALPYLDTDRLSLAAIFGITAADRKPLEARMIGSREITEAARGRHEAALRERTPDGLPSSTLDFLNAYQEAVHADPSAGFRRRQAPAVLLRYFISMSEVLRNVREHMRPGTPCWYVLGDSRSTIGGKQWTIPTVEEVTAIAVQRGFRVEDRLPITVTREDVLHSRHAITRNVALRFAADS